MTLYLVYYNLLLAYQVILCLVCLLAACLSEDLPSVGVIDQPSEKPTPNSLGEPSPIPWGNLTA